MVHNDATMRRPEMTVDNYRRVYDYIEQVEPSVGLSKFVFGALDKALRPRVIYADNATDHITEATANNLPHIYVLNHLSHLSTFSSVAAINQILHDDLGNLRMLGADFHSSSLYGRFYDKIGGIPVYRRKEHGEFQDLERAHQSMFICAMRCLAKRQKLVLAPEGDSNYGDQTKLMTLGAGVGKIAQMTALRTKTPVAITPFGSSNGGDGKAFNINVCVGNTFLATSDMTVADIVAETHENLESAVAVAHELY